MKKKIILSVFVLFVLSVIVFSVFNSQIRAALAVEVKYDYPKTENISGEMLKSLPAAAVWTYTDGSTFVWILDRSDYPPASLYVVHACPVTPIRQEDGRVFFSDLKPEASDAVAVSWDSKLREGMGVRPARV